MRYFKWLCLLYSPSCYSPNNFCVVLTFKNWLKCFKRQRKLYAEHLGEGEHLKKVAQGRFSFADIYGLTDVSPLLCYKRLNCCISLCSIASIKYDTNQMTVQILFSRALLKIFIVTCDCHQICLAKRPVSLIITVEFIIPKISNKKKTVGTNAQWLIQNRQIEKIWYVLRQLVNAKVSEELKMKVQKE